MCDEPVYLDYAATTPLDPRVADVMQACEIANPSSPHRLGRRAAAAVAAAAEQVGSLVNADPAQLIWTSGATESVNLAIRGVMQARASAGRHIVTMRTEHKAVTDTCRALEKDGFEVTWLESGAGGLLDPDHLLNALRPDTQLVSVMHVNNETGVIQDVAAIGRLCRDRKVVFHCDAAQSAGKIDVDVDSMCIDLLSISFHKFYGPQGVGALYVASRPGLGLLPVMFGGGQQKRMRPGTLPVQLIVGSGEAAALAGNEWRANLDHVATLRAHFLKAAGALDGLVTYGQPDATYPGILSVGTGRLDGESLMLAVEPVCVASGSACNSTVGEPSHVMRAMGLDEQLAEGVLRFSFGRFSTTADIDVAIGALKKALERLRKMAPVT